MDEPHTIYDRLLSLRPGSAEWKKLVASMPKRFPVDPALEKAIDAEAARSPDLIAAVRGLNETMREQAVDDYLRKAPLEEILKRLVKTRGRAAVRAALSLPGRDPLNDGDALNVWLAVELRKAVTKCNTIDACKAIARLGGVPKRLSGTRIARSDRLKAIYYAVNRKPDSGPWSKNILRELLNAHLAVCPSAASFDKWQRHWLTKRAMRG